jgi:uncharacterized protein (TIGR00369 family)
MAAYRRSIRPERAPAVRFPVRIPFVDKLGFELVDWSPGASAIAVKIEPDLCNSWSVAHGGVTMTLLDVTMAHAARLQDPASAEASGVVTVEMKTTFMRPGTGRLVGHGKLLHRTASMAFCEATVLNGAGELVAHATGTFKYLKRLPVGGRVIHSNEASD